MPNVNMEVEAGLESSNNNTEIYSHTFEDRALLDHLLVGNTDINPDDEAFCHHYLEQLASYGLSKLALEPENLKEKQSSILSQTQTLAFENYQTFIQAAECSKEVYKDFNIVEEHVNSVMENIPVFKQTIEKFAKGSQEINACRRQNTLVLSRHTQLLEILEISQLMDTCVRNGYYEEALELSNFVKRLEKKFSTIKIITDIASEVKKSTEFMLNQLLLQLKGNIQLPACLRIISYIRQLDVFTEAELRITFLQARDTWFKSVVTQIPMDEAYNHLVKVIETSRVNLFDIITQYKAIFSDDEPTYVTDTNMQYSSILHSWVIRKISEFVNTLQEDIGRGLGGRLDSVYAQCMYFGLSFSRIRADFRPIIVAVFHRHALRQFKNTVNIATRRFEDEIHTFSVASKKLKKDLYDDKRKSSSNKDPCVPPHELLDFPPLAFYLNGLLTGFNELRSYPAFPLVFQVKETLATSLAKVMLMLENWARLESRSQLNNNTDNVQSLCYIACKYFLPYVDTALKLFFKPEKVNEIIGRLPSSVDSKTSKALYTLDLISLSNHLKDFVDLDTIREIVLEDTSKLLDVPIIDDPSGDKIENSSGDKIENSIDANNKDSITDMDENEDGPGKNEDEPVAIGNAKNVETPGGTINTEMVTNDTTNMVADADICENT